MTAVEGNEDCEGRESEKVNGNRKGKEKRKGNQNDEDEDADAGSPSAKELRGKKKSGNSKSWKTWKALRCPDDVLCTEAGKRT